MLILILTILAVVFLGWPWWVIPLATALAVALIVITPTPLEREERRHGWQR